ncbi:hypothetical protein ABZ958_07325 [Streptomyces sp. NPDC046237]|uniref:hypothetical protein n=1 Tax=Streptomyces sp. NPDC046237 TaxID=3154914 RepID=UPI0033F55D6A
MPGAPGWRHFGSVHGRARATLLTFSTVANVAQEPVIGTGETMTFGDEWAQLVSEAKQRQSAGTRLNQLEPGSGGTGGEAGMDLVVTQDDLGAVGHEAFLLNGELHRRADITAAGVDRNGEGSTARAAREFADHNLTMGVELYTTLSVWDSQVKTVLQMCAHISNHLDYSKQMHANEDAAIAAALRGRGGAALPVSEISTYVR